MLSHVYLAQAPTTEHLDAFSNSDFCKILFFLKFTFSDSKVDDSDEISITRAILRQAERISEQNIILKQIDREIISNQTVTYMSRHKNSPNFRLIEGLSLMVALDLA